MSAFLSSRSFKATATAVTILGASALILSGCASDDSSSSGSTASDLSLKVGTILPQTGTLAVLGPPEIEAVNLAVSDINAADAGISIDVEQKDSGDTSTDLATQSVTALLADDVSAIIGAASSSVSLSVIDQIVAAQVVEISPANTSPTFSDYDDDGYYWRTAPSDVLQGQVLGQKIASDGALTVSVLYDNNDYGIGLNTTVTDYLESQGIDVAADVTFDEGATDFGSAVTDVLAPDPDALVVISYDELTAIAEQLASQDFDFSKLYGVDGNYGVIGPDDTNVDIAGAQFTNPGVQATDDFQASLLAQAEADGLSDDDITVFSYAPESYDATVLLALAALQGGATDGTTISENLQSVSEDGTQCDTFSDCAGLIADGEDIDYEGLSGPITFDENGDPSQAYVSIYKYTEGNENEFEESQFGDLSAS
ncbi:MAG: ABC transporter substrate-binding protein [Microbacteriaceae bacterium]